MKERWLVALLAAVVTASIGQAQSAKAIVKRITPALPGSLVAVIRIDLKQLDVDRTVRTFEKQGLSRELGLQVRRKLRILQELKRAGARELFIVQGAGPRDAGSPVIAVPLPADIDGSKARQLERLVGAVAPKLVRRGNLLLAGGFGLERRAAILGVEHPNLVPGFAAVEGRIVQIVLAPSNGVREVLLEHLALAPNFRSIDALAGLVRETEWIALGLTDHPKLAAVAVVQTTTPRGARQWQESVPKLITILGKENPPLAHAARLLWRAVKTEIKDNRLSAVGDHDHLLQAIGEVVPQLNAAFRKTALVNPLHQLSLAMHNYHDVYRSLPPAPFAPQGKQLLSWRVHVLPFLGEDKLYNQFKLNEPWDSPHNKKLIAQMPDLFRHPFSKAQPGYTTFVAPVGPGTVFDPKRRMTLGRITIQDGTSNTAMIVVANDKHAVPWTKPDDLPFDPRKPTRGLAVIDGSFVFAFCDGSVRLIPAKTRPEWIARIIQFNDGQPIPWNEIYRRQRGSRKEEKK